MIFLDKYFITTNFTLLRHSQVVSEMSHAPQHKWERRGKQILSGALAGVVAKTATAPLERIKILMQIQGMQKTASGVPKYLGVGHALQLVIREEGFRALYKGNGANVLRVIPNYALKFACTDMFKEMVKRPEQSIRDLSSMQVMYAGSIAGLVQIMVSYPLDCVRTRLSLSEGLSQGVQYKGIVDCGVQMARSEGISSLFKGIGPTFVSGAPYVGLQMMFYASFKNILPNDQNGNSTMSSSLIAGAIAGLIAQTITFPGDTVRRRMQTNGIGGHPREYKNSFDACVKIAAREGFFGFFHGWTANAVRCLPGAAIQFASYDILKKWMSAE